MLDYEKLDLLIPQGPELTFLPSPRRQDYDWMSRREWSTRLQAHRSDPAREQAELVFLGDSITQGWTETAGELWDCSFAAMKPLCLGIGGDRTQHLIWRVLRGELDGLRAKVLVLLIGTNNLGAGDSPEDTACGVEVLLETIHKKLPNTSVVILAILPSGEKLDNPLRAAIDTTNRLLFSGLADPRDRFVDLGAVFLQSDGSLSPELMPDFLHPSYQGYEVIAQHLLPVLAHYFPQPEGGE